MSLYARIMAHGSYPYVRLIAPAEPPEAPEPERERERFRHCRACDVKWRGAPECWCCGKAGR